MRKKLTGFTFIELVMVMAMIALLVSVALPRYFEGQTRAKEAVLMDDLSTMRSAIEHYYADKGYYPSTLDDLVQERYLRFIPEDPITEQSDTWVVTTPPDLSTSVYDIHSGSDETSSHGTPYNSW
jgi:general secretion pathway protein G